MQFLHTFFSSLQGRLRWWEGWDMPQQEKGRCKAVETSCLFFFFLVFFFPNGHYNRTPSVLHHVGALSLTSIFPPLFHYIYFIAWPQQEGEIAIALGIKDVRCTEGPRPVVPCGGALLLLASVCHREQPWNTVREGEKC